MAFFCPVRIRRNKKKHNGIDLSSDLPAPGTSRNIQPVFGGRITGSASIETLVRVGIEKENGLSPDSKMIVVHDFHPCVDDELEVKRGQVVFVLYQENDWVYVLSENHQQEGFIPASYCTPFDQQQNSNATDSETGGFIKKKIPRSQIEMAGSSTINYQAQVQELNEQFLRNGFSSAPETQQQQQPEVHSYRNYSPPPQSSVSNPIQPPLPPPPGLDLVSSTTGIGGDRSVRSQPAVVAASSSVISGSNKNASDPGVGGAKIVDLASNYPAFPKSTTTTDDIDQPIRSIPAVLGEVQPFFKDQNGPKYLMLYSFVGRDENDISVDRGQIVTVMNKDDTDWYWIRRPTDNQEGFVPASYLYPTELLPSQIPNGISLYH